MKLKHLLHVFDIVKKREPKARGILSCNVTYIAEHTNMWIWKFQIKITFIDVGWSGIKIYLLHYPLSHQLSFEEGKKKRKKLIVVLETLA